MSILCTRIRLKDLNTDFPALLYAITTPDRYACDLTIARKECCVNGSESCVNENQDVLTLTMSAINQLCSHMTLPACRLPFEYHVREHHGTHGPQDYHALLARARERIMNLDRDFHMDFEGRTSTRHATRDA